MSKIGEVTQVKQAVESDLLRLPGVTEIGVGFKYVAGQPANEIAIVVSVAKKKRVEQLLMNEIIPASVQGIGTDVVDSRPCPLCQHE